MPGKGEPGWVLREPGRHPSRVISRGSQTMLCIGVGFTIGHGRNPHSWGGSCLSYTTGVLGCVCLLF